MGLEKGLDNKYKVFGPASHAQNFQDCRRQFYQPLTARKTLDLLILHSQVSGAPDEQRYFSGSAALTGRWRGVKKQVCFHDLTYIAKAGVLDAIKSGERTLFDGGLVMSKDFFNDHHDTISNNKKSFAINPVAFDSHPIFTAGSQALEAYLSIREEEEPVIPHVIERITFAPYNTTQFLAKDQVILNPVTIRTIKGDDGLVRLELGLGGWLDESMLVGANYR